MPQTIVIPKGKVSLIWKHDIPIPEVVEAGTQWPVIYSGPKGTMYQACSVQFPYQGELHFGYAFDYDPIAKTFLTVVGNEDTYFIVPEDDINLLKGGPA